MSPILCSWRMSSSPGVPRSTMKARWPARPAARSTVAHTTIQSARIAFEMKVLAPRRTHVSPSRTAVVSIAATSLAAPGPPARPAPLLHAERLPEPHAPHHGEEWMIGRHGGGVPVRLDAERAEELAPEPAHALEL